MPRGPDSAGRTSPPVVDPDGVGRSSKCTIPMQCVSERTLASDIGVAIARLESPPRLRISPKSYIGVDFASKTSGDFFRVSRMVRRSGLLLVFALFSSFTSMSCLILDPPEPPQEVNYPPSIASAASANDLTIPTPLDQIVQIQVDDERRRGTTEIVFPVEIRDPNVDQPLHYQVFVDPQPSLAVPEKQSPPVIDGTGEVVRPWEFTLDLDLFAVAGRCHKVELLVSSAFGFGSAYRDPVVPGDLAQAVWWVESTDDLNTTADLSTCP